jgi:hypothetical protein
MLHEQVIREIINCGVCDLLIIHLCGWMGGPRTMRFLDSGREVISHGNTPGEHRPSLKCALYQRIHKVTPGYTFIRVPFHRRNLLLQLRLGCVRSST